MAVFLRCFVIVFGLFYCSCSGSQQLNANIKDTGPPSFLLPGSGPVQLIYLVPSDRKERSDYAQAIIDGVKDFQSWLSTELNGHSFWLAEPALKVVHSKRPAAWFQNTEKETRYSAFWKNTLQDLVESGAARLNNREMRYVVVVDSDFICGQTNSGGSGLAALGSNTLRGLVGEPIVPSCSIPTSHEKAHRCGWIGLLGHELLHTFGIMHSNQYSDCAGIECQMKALMRYGYITYPKSNLVQQEKTLLLRSGFIMPYISEKKSCR